MTTNIVKSITDEQIAEIAQDEYLATSNEVRALIYRLREAEALLAECRPVVAKEVERWRRASAILPVNADLESSLLKRIDTAMERQS
jgi:hypothetical protein